MYCVEDDSDQRSMFLHDVTAVASAAHACPGRVTMDARHYSPAYFGHADWSMSPTGNLLRSQVPPDSDRDAIQAQARVTGHMSKDEVQDFFYADFQAWIHQVARSRAARKATHRILVIQGHGSYWYMLGHTAEHKGRSRVTVLTMTWLASTLRDAKFHCDVLVGDGCQLGSLETTVEVADRCRYFVASELSLGDGGLLQAWARACAQHGPPGKSLTSWIPRWQHCFAAQHTSCGNPLTEPTDCVWADTARARRLVHVLATLPDSTWTAPVPRKYLLYPKALGSGYVAYDLRSWARHIAPTRTWWKTFRAAFDRVVRGYVQTECLQKARPTVAPRLHGLSLCLHPDISPGSGRESLRLRALLPGLDAHIKSQPGP